jgi:hypothetical protein
MSALQSQTYANSGDPYYGNPAEWYKFPSKDDKIRFVSTNAVLEVIPAVPDANTTIAFNGNQLAYVSDIPNLQNWAQYPANHNVDIPDPYVLNVSTMNNATANISTLVSQTASISSLSVSTLVSQTGSISTLSVSTLNYSFPPIGNISTLLGPTVSVTADQGLFTLSPSAIELSTVNGSYGKISLTANPGQLNTLGGQVNMTANGGNSLGGLYGAVNITANQGTDIATGITTGGKIDITANSGTGLGTATSAININSGGINSYAGFGTPIASLYGYNFINGTAGVSLCASVVPNSAFQVPGTCYLYGDTGITLGSDTYGTRFFPYWNGLTAPPNLLISGRTTIAGSAEVCLSNVSSINGITYPPPGTGYNPNPQFSTITMIAVSGSEGIINTSKVRALGGTELRLEGGNATANNSIIQMDATGFITINATAGTGGLTNGAGLIISEQGQNLTFPQNPSVTAPVGQIFNLSTINGVAYNPGGGSYPANANFSTITMNPTLGQIRTNDIKNPAGNGNDFGISQESATANLNLTVKPSGGSTAGEITINNAGSISFNEINAGSGVLVNPQGNTLTFLQTVGSVNQGQIVGLSTINSVAYPPSNFVDSFQIYVAPNGNNTTGDGSQQNPYLTIAQAITKRATIANTTEVSIILSSGLYTETFTLTRNTYLVGVQTGEARQPVNITGTITLNDTTGSMGLSGLEIVGNVSCTGAGGSYTIFGCNISNSNVAVNATSGTVFITECRLSTSFNAVIISSSTLTVRDCNLSTSGTGACLSVSTTATVRQCVLTSTSASTGVSSLITYTNATLATFVIEFCRLEYTNATTDVTGNKTCIRFNGAGPVTASVSQCLLICEGAITGSGGQIQCIQKTGAGAVVLAYGQLIAGATANHIAPTIVKTQYNTVP